MLKVYNKTSIARYLTKQQVADRYGISVRTLTRWVKKGLFPKPVRINCRSLRWRVSDLNNYDKDIAPT